jgi:hypothetical protein
MATDALKRDACCRRGVRLIEIEAVKRPFPPEHVLQKVAMAFELNELKAVPILPSVDPFESELKLLRAMVAQRGGTLVSSRHLGGESHEWKCMMADHATWHAEP